LLVLPLICLRHSRLDVELQTLNLVAGKTVSSMLIP